MFRTPHSVVTYAAVNGAKDAHGNPVVTFDEGVAQSVIAIAPAAADREAGEVGRTAVIRDLDLLVGPDFVIGPHDRVAVLGVTYEVVGHPEDYTHGPFGFEPGARVSLKRVEG